MKKPRSFSPIAIVEQLLFEKLGDTKVRVWQYCALLSLLFLVPMVMPDVIFTNVVYFQIFTVLMIVVWMTSRLVGRQLSKTSSIDSVLIYRFFALVSWVAPTLLTLALLLRSQLDAPTRTLHLVLFIFMAVVSSVHIIGVILHLRSLKKTIRNVNKEDLFQ